MGKKHGNINEKCLIQGVNGGQCYNHYVFCKV